MKKITYFSLVLLTSFILLSFREDCKDLPWGTKTTYHFMNQVHSNPPAGYEAVFLNYMGRHGARFQTSITSDSLLFLTLQQKKGKGTDGNRSSFNANGFLIINHRKGKYILVI